MTPNLLEHANHTKEIYGITGEDIHKWIDNPVKLFGVNHRTIRHDPNQDIPKIFIDKYGLELARNIIIDHMILDLSSNKPIPTTLLKSKYKPKLDKENFKKVLSELENLEHLYAFMKCIFKKRTKNAMSVLAAFYTPIHIHNQHEIIEFLNLHPDAFYYIKTTLLNLNMIEKTKIKNYIIYRHNADKFEDFIQSIIKEVELFRPSATEDLSPMELLETEYDL